MSCVFAASLALCRRKCRRVLAWFTACRGHGEASFSCVVLAIAPRYGHLTCLWMSFESSPCTDCNITKHAQSAERVQLLSGSILRERRPPLAKRISFLLAVMCRLVEASEAMCVCLRVCVCYRSSYRSGPSSHKRLSYFQTISFQEKRSYLCQSRSF